MARPVVHLIPHTHWDREWYLPLGGFRARLAEAVDDVLGLLHAAPEVPAFHLDGQTVLLGVWTHKHIAGGWFTLTLDHGVPT